MGHHRESIRLARLLKALVADQLYIGEDAAAAAATVPFGVTFGNRDREALLLLA